MVGVVVKVFASLQEHAPAQPRMELPDACDINTLLDLLGLPAEGRYITLVNGVPEWNRTRVLQENDVVAIFPLIAGG